MMMMMKRSSGLLVNKPFGNLHLAVVNNGARLICWEGGWLRVRAVRREINEH